MGQCPWPWARGPRASPVRGRRLPRQPSGYVVAVEVAQPDDDESGRVARPEQQAAIAAIGDASGTFAPFLLFGVTGNLIRSSVHSQQAKRFNPQQAVDPRYEGRIGIDVAGTHASQLGRVAFNGFGNKEL